MSDYSRLVGRLLRLRANQKNASHLASAIEIKQIFNLFSIFSVPSNVLSCYWSMAQI